MLQRARGLTREGPPPLPARITQLQAILDTRDAIARASGLKLDPASPEYAFKTDGLHGWLFGKPLGDVPKEFLDRQRFKGLSDLADRIRAQGRPGSADGLALAAFRIAVQNVQFLIGPNDLVRIERVRKHATQQKIVDFKPLTLDRTRSTTAARPAQTWVLTDAPGGQPAYVRIEREDLLAAQIVDELSRTGGLSRPVRLRGFLAYSLTARASAADRSIASISRCRVTASAKHSAGILRRQVCLFLRPGRVELAKRAKVATLPSGEKLLHELFRKKRQRCQSPS